MDDFFRRMTQPDFMETWKGAAFAREVAVGSIPVLLAGQMNDTAEMLALAWLGAEAANIGSEMQYIIRRHPRETAPAKFIADILFEEMAELVPMCFPFSERRRKLPDWMSGPAEEFLPLLGSRGFVLTGYSTVGYVARSLGYRCVYAGTPGMRWDHAIEKSCVMPFDAMGQNAAYMSEVPEMRKYLERTMEIPHDPSRAPVFTDIGGYPSDFRATERMAAQIEQLAG